MQEEWRDVVGYEGRYRVSNFGRVLSVRQNLIMNTGKYGRPAVNLWKYNRMKRRMVHRLVLEAFIGPCPDGMECCHNDGNPFNNNLDNLRWDTQSANMMDRVLHGTSNRGERQGSSILTEALVLEARELRKKDPQRWTYRKLGIRYGVKSNCIQRAVTGDRWGWLK